ncbi:hydroxyphenylacetyl-CoA thioesterase PaaI [Mesorhizobium sp. NBSH29]|uniref:hydroxyphenylacetyl-CoA thioesterase PaaI n=1 Tax=Mesorhizobium sp. NBSH29 TaxID=2654249 RepID=UPI0018969A31|nr:hydroxyphenylacetyl-CoA thioesterase PaaI [Mesorhizobium sp. NBSH29]QPC88252.1 hydroxyphenylacetyl-CoA thioesterase PaaI [Mesorhizobium sp. NBSH29]
MTPEEIAQQSAKAMWEKDAATKWLGAVLDAVGPGTARMSMTVAPHHTNGHGICHGGFIFTLADSAFAFACNSYNQCAVAQHNTITYLAPAKLGDLLRATASEISRSGRSGLYDVTIRDQEGRKIAEFRGASRIIKGVHFEDAAQGGTV